MKKIITLFFLLLSIVAYSQTSASSETRFLGIPVDGFKPQMIQKLKAKGFTYHSQDDYLSGEFNGRKVNLFVGTYNNKVWRIMVQDETPSSKIDIKIRFNTLCDQFDKNKRYVHAYLGDSDFRIPEDEDISLNIISEKKRYEADYWQINEKLDSAAIINELKPKIMEKYSGMNTDSMSEEGQEKLKADLMNDFYQYLIDKFSKNSVWFMISKDESLFSDYDRPYRILMYYDNHRNQSNGEDL